MTHPLPPHDPPRMTGLPDKQRKLLHHWVVETRRTGRPPTIREARPVIGTTSTSVVYYHLQQLAERGLLVHDKRRAYSYRVAPALLPSSAEPSPTEKPFMPRRLRRCRICGASVNPRLSDQPGSIGGAAYYESLCAEHARAVKFGAAKLPEEREASA